MVFNATFNNISAISWLSFRKKSFNIRKGQSQSVNRRRKQTQWQTVKEQRTSNDLQNTTLKTKDRATRTPLKTGGEIRCSGKVASSCSIGGTCCVTLITNPMKSHE